MARDTNKPQGKPYVFEPPVHKFREKMGKRETYQVCFASIEQHSFGPWLTFPSARHCFETQQYTQDKRANGPKFMKRQHVLDDAPVRTLGIQFFVALALIALLAFASTLPAVQDAFARLFYGK